MRIGFVGLGNMGLPMAKNLVEAGHEVITTWHTNKKPAEELEKHGALLVDDVEKIAKLANLVITILPKDEEILDVYLSEKGILNNMKKCGVCIDFTSSKPDTIKKVAQSAAMKKIDIIDATVSGGVPKAKSGTLTIMAGGVRETIDKYMSIFNLLGASFFYTGDVGTAKAVKMINQLLNAANTCILSEALVLSRKMGIEDKTLRSIVSESSGASWALSVLAERSIFPEDFEPGFKLSLMNKDLSLNMEQIKESGLFLPVVSLVYQMYMATSNDGNDDKYYSIISKWIAKQNIREK